MFAVRKSAVQSAWDFSGNLTGFFAAGFKEILVSPTNSNDASQLSIARQGAAVNVLHGRNEKLSPGHIVTVVEPRGHSEMMCTKTVIMDSWILFFARLAKVWARAIEIVFCE